MTDKIYGGWSEIKKGNGLALQGLWHALSAQQDGPNNGLTQRKNEIIELWQLFQRQQPSVIVEIGVAQGGTFASWCQLAGRDATLIGIDRCVDDCRPRPGDPVHKDIYRGHLAKTSQGGGMHHLARRGQTIIPINGWSHEHGTQQWLRDALKGRGIDFLFHDASHEASMFARDFEIYWPFISDGGIFASHDINHSADPKCNKRDAWEKIKASAEYSACYEYLPHPSITEMGIGVLIK